MNDSIATLTAQPTRMLLGTKEYEIAPLTWNDFGVIQAWCDRQWPDPLAAVAKHLDTDEFTVEQERYLMRLAVEQATRPKPQLGSPECTDLMRTVKGVAFLVYLAIHKRDPGFTEAMAEQIIREASASQITQLFKVTTSDLVMSNHDPKANGSETANGSTSG